MSPDYFQSAWAQQEWQYALADEINHRNIRLIPVLYRGYEIPIILRTKHWVDFRDASQYRLLVDRLVNDLRLLALGDRPSQSGTEPPKPGERGEELDPTTLSELKKALSGRGRCVQDKARQAAG